MRRWIKRIFIALVVVGMPATAFWFYAAWQGDRELREAMAELDALGEPWRWEDLEAERSKSPPAIDIRDLILRVNNQVSASFSSRTTVERALDRPSYAMLLPDEFEVFDEDMRSVAAALDEARTLSKLPNARLHATWPPNLAFPNLDDVQRARSVIYILQCGAAWHAQQGDLDAALDDCLAMLRLTQALQDELTLIQQLVRVALQAITIHNTERVLAQTRPTKEYAEQLQRLQTVWEQFDTGIALRQGIRGERAASHRLYESLESGKERMSSLMPGKTSGMEESFTNAYFQFNMKPAHAWTLRYMTKLVQIVDLPEPERAARWNELEQEARRAPGVAKMLVPSIHKVFDAHRRGDAQARSLIAGLAAERFRLDNERWPKSLTELTPKHLAKIPDDPYTGKPLQMRATDDGIVIYSVGPDGKQRGEFQEETALKRFAIRYEFRLWNVGQRRQLVAKEP